MPDTSPRSPRDVLLSVLSMTGRRGEAEYSTERAMEAFKAEGWVFTRAEAAAEADSEGIRPGDVPDSVVIQTALYERLGGDWDALDELADACLDRLREYGRVVVRVRSGDHA
jgi:hypothetical protein